MPRRLICHERFFEPLQAVKYDEQTLLEMKNKELKDIMRENSITGLSGTKKELVKRITKHFESTKSLPRPEKLDIESLDFQSRESLVSQLNQFTVNEVREELARRGGTKAGSKADVIERLADIVYGDYIITQMTRRFGESTEWRPKDVADLDITGLLVYLNRRMDGLQVDFSKFVDLKAFVYSLVLNDNLFKMDSVSASKEEMMDIIVRIVDGLKPDNLTTEFLHQRCLEFGIEVAKEDSREVLVEVIENDAEAKIEAMEIDSAVVQQRVYDRLDQWMSEIQDDLMRSPVFRSISDLSQEDLVAELGGMAAESSRKPSELVRMKRMIDTQFFPRSLMLLASGIFKRTMGMTESELESVFEVDKSLLEQSEAFRLLVQQAFVEATIQTFDLLHDKTMVIAQETEIQLQSREGDVREEEEEEQVTEEPRELVMDPPLSIAVVFGGAKSRAVKTFSAVRCLLDLLQTAPTDFEDRQRTGMNVSLYYLRLDGETISAHKLSYEEFLSLDASAFRLSPTGIFDLGEQATSLDAFVEEVQGYDRVISLTPSLDVIGLEDKDLRSKILKLDRTLVGSSEAVRRVTRNRHSCCAYLKNRGFVVPNYYRIEPRDLDDLETWCSGFRNWCGGHHIDPIGDEFWIYPSNLHDQQDKSDCKGLGDIVEKSRISFEKHGMTEVTIEATMPSGEFVDYACCVIETDAGPVALAPTEFELIPLEYTRSLSSPLRRHTPPRLTHDKVQGIRLTAERAFEELGMSGYACVRGRVLVDPEIEEAIRTEEKEFPRPIPEEKEIFDDFEMPDEVYSYMEEIYAELEAEADEIVKAYDEEEYTEDAINFFRFLDQQDAEQGIQRNRIQELDQLIERLRHRNDVEVETEEDEEMAKMMAAAMVRETGVGKLGIGELSRGENFVIMVTDVENRLEFSVDGLVFQQAAISGLSHAAVIRHILNQTLPESVQLPQMPLISKKWNPLYAHDFPEEPFNPNSEPEEPIQVWILCGGEGTGQQASLASGLNALMKLSRTPGLQPHLFIVDSSRRSAASPRVLKALYDRRAEMEKNKVLEEDLLEELTLPYINFPKVDIHPVPWRMVWYMHHAHCLYPTVDEAIEAADRLRLLSNMSKQSYNTLMEDFETNLLTCQAELNAAGVVGVAGLWGGAADEIPPPPRMVTMDVFASHANAAGAAIFNVIHGDAAQTGELQDFFDSSQLLYTGCSRRAAELCGDKDEANRFLESVDCASGLGQRYVTLEEIEDCASSEESAEELFRGTQALFRSFTPICIKPTKESFGTGVARLSSARDLRTYSEAVVNRWESLDEDRLTPPHCLVPMPNPTAEEYVLEQYVKPCKVVYDKTGQLVLAGVAEWAEVSFSLIGEFGRMWVMSPSLIVSSLETHDAVEDRLMRGMKTAITPIPVSIAQQEVIKEAKRRVERLADLMGLKGVAKVDAFMNLKTGRLAVLEVDTTPYLGEHSLILQQAVMEKPPMFPDEVFQQILKVAYLSDEGVVEEQEPLLDPEEGLSSLSPWEDNEFWETEQMPSSKPSEESLSAREALDNLWGSDDEDETFNESLQNAS